MFKNRKQQRTTALLTIMGVAVFIALLMWQISTIQPPPVNGSYWIGSVLPVISIIFIIMAIRGIKKDEKLVRSLDRLR